MRKIIAILSCLLFGLTVFLPLGVVLSAIFGYQFTLADPMIFLIITVVVAAVLVALSIITKETVDNSIIQIIISILTPCALLSTAFYVTACGGKCVILCLLLCAGCCYLTIRHGNPQTVKAGALVLTASLILPVCLCCVVMVAVHNEKADIVVQTVDSPSGSYYATVINSDQGDNKGNTIVKVYKTKGIDAGLFRITKKPQRVYVGEYGEFEELEVVWKNEERLLINSAEYIIE